MAKDKSKPPENDEITAPGWMCTYADLMSLLLCFFILLFAFSTLDNKKIKEVLISLRGAFGVFQGGNQALKQGTDFNITESQTAETAKTRYGLEEAQKKVRKALGGLGLSKKIGVRKGAEGIILTFPDSILFEPASARLSPEGRENLSKVYGILKGFESRIRVEGHTDNVPVGEMVGSRFASNWELSTARGLAVLHWLADEGGFPQARLSVAGYAANKPAPGGDNTTPLGREKNRRVELVLLAEKRDDEGSHTGSMEVRPRPSDAEPSGLLEPL